MGHVEANDHPRSSAPLFLLTWVLLPNLPFISTWLFYCPLRVHFIFVYALLGLVRPRLGSVATCLFFILIYALDVTSTVMLVFNFAPALLLWSIRDLTSLNVYPDPLYATEMLLGAVTIVGVPYCIFCYRPWVRPYKTFVMGLALAAADVAANMTPSNSGRVELAVTPGADESALSAVGALGVGARFPKPSGRALCLPTRLRAAGYETVALHGFTKYLFDRSRWYPHIGLPSMYFREELPVIGLSSVCGNVFPSICDDEIGRYIGRLLHAQPSPRLIYWLTLNSHVPAFLETGEPDIFLCTDRGGPFADISVCRLATKCRAVMKAVSRMATDPANANVEFLIVGDHAPPIFSRKGRRMFESNVWSPGYSCGQARTRHRVPPALRPSHPGAGSKYSMSLNWSTNWLMRWSAIGFRKWRPCQRLARSD